MEEEQQLKEKAILLVRRERELFALRMKNEQVASWLRLTQTLPRLIDRSLARDKLYAGLGRALITGLRVQRAAFFDLVPGALRPIAAGQSMAARPLDAGAAALLEQVRSGLCNEPDETGRQPLAAALGLHRFIWTSIHASDEERLLLVAGFDRERAKFQAPFDESNAAHMGNVGQHIETLLKNMLLVNELERDKQRLLQFNDTLERRVVERTRELAHANAETAKTLVALEEKDVRLQDDLRQARSFQQGILPTLKPCARIDFATVYRPLDLVGGDIYDVCEIAPDHHRMFVADATGHGVQASLRTIVLKGEYDRLKEQHATPDLVLRDFNRRLESMYAKGEMLSTGCCFDIDLRAAGRPLLRYSDAAHPPLLHVSGGVVRPISLPGPYLGLKPDASFPLVEVPLQSGDMILAYSDGISEQCGPANASFDFLAAVTTALQSAGALSDVLERIVPALDRFRGPVPMQDDVTLVAARIR
jgi:serine phosphatase RsbU (regulator of sigma subunit)